MRGEWPLVGRKPERLRLHPARVRSARRGAGRAAMCRQDTSGHGLPGTGNRGRLRCPAGVGHPSFLTPAVRGLRPPDTRPPIGLAQTDMLRQVTQAIIDRRGQRRGVALLIDDAHLLDRASAALTHQLATNETVFMLATVRSAEPSADAVMALWKDGILERFDLAPFPEAEVESFLTMAVGGPIDRATLHFFVQRTQGNALFLRELLLAALESGFAVRRQRRVARPRSGPCIESPA